METDAAFVGADAVVVLHTITHIGLYFSLVVHPIHAELVDTVGDAEALDELHLLKFRVLVVLFFNCGEHFFDSLMVLGFVGKTEFNLV